MKKTLKLVLGAAAVLSLSACSSTDEPYDQTYQNPYAPVQLTQSQSEMLNHQNANTLKLMLQGVKEGQSNFAVAPIALNNALGMLANGADGAALTALTGYLGGDLTAINNFSEGMRAFRHTDEMSRLNIYNTIIYQKDAKFEDTFLNVIKDKAYGSTENKIESTNDLNATISAWANASTDGAVKNVNLNGDTPEFALLNSTNFNLLWMTGFISQQTTTDAFTNVNGGTVDVNMMHKIVDNQSIVRGNGFSSTVIKGGNNFNVRFILPDENKTISDVLASLTVNDLVGAEPVATEVIEMIVPVCNVKNTWTLTDNIASAIGLKNAFSGASYSKILSGKSVTPTFIQSISMYLDEGGLTTSEIAGSTFATKADTANAAKLYLNRPFIYVAYDEITGAIIYIGVIDTLAKS